MRAEHQRDAGRDEQHAEHAELGRHLAAVHQRERDRGDEAEQRRNAELAPGAQRDLASPARVRHRGRARARANTKRASERRRRAPPTSDRGRHAHDGRRRSIRAWSAAWRR